MTSRPIECDAASGASAVLKLRRIAASDAAETKKEAASSTKMSATGITASNEPASKGPRTVAAEKLAWMRPLAATRSSVGTRLGMAANWAASKAIEIVAAMNE